MFLSDIVRELEENEEIKKDFGEDLKPKRDDKGSLVKWSDKEIVTQGGVKITAKGMKTSLRGIRNQEKRPDLIIVDDPENDELVETEHRRKKNLLWFNKSLQNTLSRNGDIFVLGSRIHYDCLTAKLLDDSEYKKVWQGKAYKAINIDDQGKEYALWPEWWSLKRLYTKKDEIKSLAFEQEYQNNPINPEDQLFKEEWFKYYSLADIQGLSLAKFAFLDPAISKKDTADFSAIAVIGRADNGNLYVLYAWIDRTSPLNLVEKVFEVYDKHKVVKFGIESNAFQAVIKTLVDERSRKDKVYIPTYEVKQISDKIMRIGKLSPLLEQGIIYFCLSSEAGNQRLLIEQMQQFPMGAHDDGPDAIEGAVDLARDQSRPRFRQL